MSDIDKEERIRIRAHEIWERQGKPQGRQEEHWDLAKREIEMEDEDTADLQSTLANAIGGDADAEMNEDVQSAQHTAEPAEGDRGTVDRELARKTRID